MTLPTLEELQVRSSIEQFMYFEARLLDEGRLEEWVALFTEDARYLMPIRETRSKRAAEIRESSIAIFDHDKRFMLDWVRRLGTGLAHAEDPPSRVRRCITNLETEKTGERDFLVRTNCVVHQSRLERTEADFVVHRVDELRMSDDSAQSSGQSWQIRRRTVVPNRRLIPRGISFFF